MLLYKKTWSNKITDHLSNLGLSEFHNQIIKIENGIGDSIMAKVSIIDFRNAMLTTNEFHGTKLFLFRKNQDFEQ